MTGTLRERQTDMKISFNPPLKSVLARSLKNSNSLDDNLRAVYAFFTAALQIKKQVLTRSREAVKS
jgi:hypothetical protein